uniref:Uncharacterized protein n=1 Tax=Sphaeramia orbicularis TaxID=375764 RepID=A0A672Y6F6_9TELE
MSSGSLWVKLDLIDQFTQCWGGCLHVPCSCTVSYREAKVKVQDFGEAALGFAGAYYEDHIQPVTASYTDWASGLKSTLWEKIKTTIDDYSPFN